MINPKIGLAPSIADEKNAGILEAASDESPANKDAHVGHTFGFAGDLGLVDRKGPQQEWSLLHSPRSQDGGIWRLHQRAIGPCFDQYSPEALQGTYEFEIQDSPDSGQQLARKWSIVCYTE